MPTFCRVLAGVIAAGSFAFVAYELRVASRSHDQGAPIVAAMWLPAAVCSARRAVRADSGARAVWVAAAAPAAVMLTFEVFAVMRAGVGSADPPVLGWLFAVLVLSVVGSALDRPARADEPGDA